METQKTSFACVFRPQLLVVQLLARVRVDD
jgi:hypothetical protein